jgi:hypothetical protein
VEKATAMNEQLPPENIEKFYIQEQLLEYAEAALTQLAPIFLGDNTGELLDHLSIKLRLNDQKMSMIPTAQFDIETRNLEIIIEPEAVMEGAEELADEINHDIGRADVARMLVSTGVARTILGWKTSASGLDNEKTADIYKELICNKDYLWEEAARLDDTKDTNLRRAVERLGDAQIMRINFMRFAIGASLRLTSDVPDLQQAFVHHMRDELSEKENLRSKELEMMLGWLEADNAFRIYDENTPEIELAFSFPMTPAEEQRFLDY